MASVGAVQLCRGICTQPGHVPNKTIRTAGKTGYLLIDDKPRLSYCQYAVLC